jgi:PAS domain S-box-containing protein
VLVDSRDLCSPEPFATHANAMISASLRPDEANTLSALAALEVLDSDSEAAFEALVQAAAAVCGAPISLISLVDAERQWFKANLGLPGVTETPRDMAFCAHAVLGDDLFEVADALEDTRFVDNPLVTAAPHIRFYAGMPVRIGPGSAVGTLCVIDRQPRQLDDRQREVLRQLALAASAMLTGRAALRREHAARKDLAARLTDLRQLVDTVPSMLGYWNRDLTCRFANRAYASWFGADADALVGCHISQLLGPELYALNRPRLEAALNGEPQVFERDVVGPDQRVRQSLAHYQPDVVDGVVVGILVAVSDVTSLKEAETRAAALQDENRRLAMVARLTSNAVFTTDAQRRITWVNAGFERMSGYSAEEALGRIPRELVGFEGTDPATVERLTHAQQTGQAIRCEILNRGKTGRIYWAAKELQPLHDADGQIAGFMSIETDITDRVHAEAAIRSNQSLLEMTGRIGGVGGWTIDLQTQQVDLADQTRCILEMPPGAAPTLAECVNWCVPQERHQLEQAIRGGLAGGPRWEYELPFVTATGRSIWVRLVAECEYVGQRASRIVGTLQDITVRRAAEAAARRNETLLRGAIDAIDEAFVLYDPDDRLVFCNDKYRAVYAASADLFVPGATFESIVREGARRGQYQDAIGRTEEWVAERMAAHRAGNATLIQKIDSGRTLRIIERKMPDGHVVGFRIDTTDLVRATEAAEESSRAKSDFIANMSHELRTPLQSINGYAELGQHIAQREGQLRFHAMFGKVLRGGQRMLSLVNDLLDLSAIDAPTLALTRRPEDLSALTQDVCEELMPLALARAIQLEPSLSMPALPVHADAGRLQQVLRNVLANAIRFAPAGSVVMIDGVDRGHGGIELTVRDHGPGIPPDELEDIFSPFVQSSRTRDGSGGSGLGLAISRRIMTAHGGTITAENAPGGGALLRLHMPNVHHQPGAVHAASPLHGSTPPNGIVTA